MPHALCSLPGSWDSCNGNASSVAVQDPILLKKPSLDQAASTMKSQALFDAMSAAVKAKGPELVKLGGAAARTILDLARFGLDPGVGRDTVSCSYSAEVFQFVISDAGPEGKFVLDLKNGSGSAKAGEESSAAGNLARLNLRSRHAQHVVPDSAQSSESSFRVTNRGLHHYHGGCGLGVHGRRQAGWYAGFHGRQVEDQGQHDAGPKASIHSGGCQVSSYDSCPGSVATPRFESASLIVLCRTCISPGNSKCRRAPRSCGVCAKSHEVSCLFGFGYGGVHKRFCIHGGECLFWILVGLRTCPRCCHASTSPLCYSCLRSRRLHPQTR